MYVCAGVLLLVWGEVYVCAGVLLLVCVCLSLCVCIVLCYYFELAKDMSMLEPLFLAQKLHNYMWLLRQHK